MTTSLNLGVVLIWILFVMMLGGALIATVSMLRRRRGPKERTFILKACAGAWGLFFLFLVLMLVLQPPYRYVAIGAFLVLFPAIVYRWATVSQLIRHIDDMDEQERAQESSSDSISTA